MSHAKVHKKTKLLIFKQLVVSGSNELSLVKNIYILWRHVYVESVYFYVLHVCVACCTLWRGGNAAISLSFDTFITIFHHKPNELY